MANVSVICFLTSYLVAFVLELTRLKRRTTTSRTIMMIVAAAGLVAHTWYLLERSRQTSLPPLLSSPRDWLLVLAWLAVVLYLSLTLFDRDLAVGQFLLPLVLILILSTYLVNDVPSTELTAHRGWTMLHASLLVFGIAGVLSGFVLGMMYLAQHHRLKRRQTIKTGLRLPNLEVLARLNRWAVIVSIPLLTLGMATGVGLALYSRTGPKPLSLKDPVVVINGIIWVVMVCFFIWLIRSRRPAGKQVAWLTLWAFGFLLVTLIGLQVLSGEGVTILKSWHTHRILDHSMTGT